MSPGPRARRASLVVLAGLFAAACGLDVVGTGASLGVSGDGGVAASLPARSGEDASAPPSGDASALPLDAGVEAGLPPVVPSHVAATFDPAATSISGVTEIDTTTLTVTGATVARFEDVAGVAVLHAKDWTVDKPVRVIGTRKLVVLAAGTVIVRAAIDAGARGKLPGPGGGAPGTGAGAGGNGVHQGADDSTGGGGGGFGGAGARGGNVSGALGGAGGQAYGAARTDFFAGSGGGRGADACDGDTGGAGGGALQITSAVAIQIARGGSINAGGGGGTGGCDYRASAESAGGGGGGSGGLVFLEAPAISVVGSLSANGGGGGGGSNYNSQISGSDGNDAVGTGVAAGGVKGQTSPGGAGATRTSPPVQPGGIVANNAGGGGGGVGRIWLRTRVASPVTAGATLSPAPAVDTTL